MKTTKFLLRLILPMLFLFSCDWPETVVTNIVHPDGSVTRIVTMKNDKPVIDPANYRVPLDSTWSFTKTFEMKGKDNKDTVWIVTAQKDFPSVEEINRDYLTDKGSNNKLKRSAEFTRHFQWFNTFYRYSEKVEKVFNTTLKAEECMNQEELKYFYMPQSMIDSLKEGPDSLKYQEIEKKTKAKEDEYCAKAIVNEWLAHYYQINPDTGYVNPRKEKLVEMVFQDVSEDSIFLLALGEDYFTRNKAAIDTALAMVDSTLNAYPSHFYTCETLMPAALVSTNGFVDSTGKISWPVDSKYYLSQDYVMWAESKQVNTWAWVVSGVFVLFVIVGLAVRFGRRRE